MRRQICPEGQIDIFPTDMMTELFAHKPPVEPLPALPIERNKEVDMARACKILDTNRTTLTEMIDAGLIRGYCVKSGRRSRAAYRIEHASLVEYGDKLRARYWLPKRKASPLSRPPDHAILPFPPSETITIGEVMDKLGIGRVTIYRLFQSGDLAGYQLIESSRWRIHQPSVVAYIQRLRRQTGIQ